MKIEKFVLNREGVRELMKSSEMESVCRDLAEGVAMRCGEGYSATSYVGKTRVNASVVATTKEAIKDNSKNNTVLTALGGGKQ